MCVCVCVCVCVCGCQESSHAGTMQVCGHCANLPYWLAHTHTLISTDKIFEKQIDPQKRRRVTNSDTFIAMFVIAILTMQDIDARNYKGKKNYRQPTDICLKKRYNLFSF